MLTAMSAPRKAFMHCILVIRRSTLLHRGYIECGSTEKNFFEQQATALYLAAFLAILEVFWTNNPRLVTGNQGSLFIYHYFISFISATSHSVFKIYVN